jgi:hypothetical protein
MQNAKIKITMGYGDGDNTPADQIINITDMQNDESHAFDEGMDD